jgi:hypothetical protein
MLSGKNWSENIFNEPYTDASGNSYIGCDCYFRCQWCAFKWPDHWEELIFKDITYLELVPIFLALQLWGNEMKNKKVMCPSANKILVLNITLPYLHILKLLKYDWRITIYYDVQQIAEYIAFMSLKQYAYKTINSYTSDISDVNKLVDMVDNTHTHTYARTHARTHPHTHTHIYSYNSWV